MVGVGQSSNPRDLADIPDGVRSPVGLFADAARAADRDAGGLLGRVDTIGVVLIGSWRYPDAGAVAARELRVEPRHTVVSSIGGNSPQLLVNELAADIQRGQRDVVLIGGGEVLHARRRARALGIDLNFETTDDAPCEHIIGTDAAGTNEHENAHGAVAPTSVYPLFETALRAAAGRSVADHQRFVGELWSGFSAAAAANPAAWTRTAYTASDIVDVTADNRIITFPYTKRMCSNIAVDQGAAVLLTSYETARAAGIADEHCVFLHAGADAHDHWWVTSRASLGESVAIGTVVHAALEAAGVGIDDVARFDLYSCFPSAVELALGSTGLRGPAGGDDRPLTVTGGLGFAGGPLNNYSTHGIARMVELLRADPGSFGVTTALGWYATKHSCGVWSTTPPRASDGYRRIDPEATQDLVDATPSRQLLPTYSGPATVEATAVPFDRDHGPTLGIVSALTPDGDRVLANVGDPTALAEITTDGWDRRAVRVAPGPAGTGTNRIEDAT